jgi:hypothetical protein
VPCLAAGHFYKNISERVINLENTEPQQSARLTEDEIKFIKAYRSLAESEKEKIIEQINNIIYDYEKNKKRPYR